MLRLDAHAAVLELRLSPKAFHNAVARRLSADQRHPKRQSRSSWLNKVAQQRFVSREKDRSQARLLRLRTRRTLHVRARWRLDRRLVGSLQLGMQVDQPHRRRPEDEEVSDQR